MAKDSNRDDFSPATVEAIAKRASYICSSPDCRCLTLCPSENDVEKFINIGKAAHITAASPRGPRYDPTLTREQRSSAENGIFLCAVCADKIDKNKGIDYPVDLLRKWKSDHERWVKENLNKNPFINPAIAVINGTHHAKGIGNVTGIDVQGPVIFKPGTQSIAEGTGNITATRIAGKED